jgi:hypothetical protein
MIRVSPIITHGAGVIENGPGAPTSGGRLQRRYGSGRPLTLDSCTAGLGSWQCWAPPRLTRLGCTQAHARIIVSRRTLQDSQLARHPGRATPMPGTRMGGLLAQSWTVSRPDSRLQVDFRGLPATVPYPLAPVILAPAFPG